MSRTEFNLKTSSVIIPRFYKLYRAYNYMKYLYHIYLSYIFILFCLLPTEVPFEFLIIQVWISDVLTHSKKCNPFHGFSPKNRVK